jgi:UDPglucose--hexose-1-phosphate uridylyltransferase
MEPNELRQNPITGNWVVITKEEVRDYSHYNEPANCPFCPGNEDKTPPEICSIGKKRSPDTPGWSLRVVPDKFPTLQIEGRLNRRGEGLFNKMSGIGAHELVVETPDHFMTLAEMPLEDVTNLFGIYQRRIKDLKKDERFRYVLAFKNHGQTAGAAFVHSHSSIIASPFTPRRVKDEFRGAKEYFDFKERCLFCDIIRQEQEAGKRVIYENADFIAIVAFAPRYRYETWILPKRHEAFFEESDLNLANLADASKIVLERINSCLNFPAYNMALHNGPNLLSSRNGVYWDTVYDDFHWHIEIMPRVDPLSGSERSSIFGLTPISPEEAAKNLSG